MAEPIYAQQQKLEELIEVLKKAESALTNAGKAAESTSSLIELLGDALAGALDVVPSLEQIEKAIERIKSGVGSVVDLGPSVGRNRGVAEATRGWKLYSETVGKDTTEATKQLADEIQNLNDADLRDLSIELEKITKVAYPIEDIRAFVSVLQELDSISGLSQEQILRLDDLADAAAQIDIGWTKAIDTLNSLSKVDIGKVAQEYKKLSDTDLGLREIENLLKVGKRAADSVDIQLSTLQTALENVRKQGEIEIEIAEPERIETAKEIILELQDSIARLSRVDLSKVAEEYEKLTGVSDFPVENLKSFSENIEEILSKDPSRVEVLENIIKAIENLRDLGEIPRLISVLGEEILKLSDTDLSKLSEEFKEISKTGSTFPVENIKSFAEALSKFDISAGKSQETISVLEKAFNIITDTSSIATRDIRKLGESISNLEDVNIQRIGEEFKRLTGIDAFPIENIKAFVAFIKDLENRTVISEQQINTVKALSDAFNAIRTEEALPFEELTNQINTNAISAETFTEKLKGFEDQLSSTGYALSNFNLEMQFLEEGLRGVGLPEESIERILRHFDDLGKIESPARLFQELSELGLPNEEIEKFANSFVVLRKNSEQIVRLRDNLENLGIAKESIEEVISTFIHLDAELNRLSGTYSKSKAGAEALNVTSRDLAGFGRNFSFEIDEVTRKLINFKEATEDTIPPVERFIAVLAQQGIPQNVIDDLVGETFDQGATDFSKINISDVADNLTQYSTTVQYGEDASKKLVFVINDLGESFRSLSEATATNPLEDFIKDLESFQVPESAIESITGETFDEGKGLSSVRIKEINDEITQLTGTIKAAGGTTKAYVVYFDQMGNVMKQLPVDEVKVSMQDFTDQLAGRVGAIDNVNKMLEKYGFEISQLKKMTTEASTGITRLDFAMDSQGGATQKLTLHVTEFGKVLTDTQRRFRTFAGGIARNVGESFKWAVAITAVYGPLRKLQDLIQISIDNESKLADIGVVLGKNTAELQGVFSDAVSAAKATGESLNGVIEGYALAYRATGSLATETERTAVANQLLVDSLVLSKLSTLDQAEAMDTLVAGLLQVGYNLDQGAELLNKWVAVSKAANVTVDTLATSFAIMATAAEGVGLSFDELNAIVAVVAANTELSATQAGNAVRAFVSGFQTDNAREELAKFGIAVEDLNGDSRNFMSVMYDIKELMDAGLIDDAELNRIGTALGGRGARRGAQFTTFLKSLDEVQGLVTVSAEAQADAYDALGVKMDTVQTSLTNLATSFQELANTMGTEGGVLDLLKFFIDILDSVVDKIGDFVSVMGKAAPYLVAGGGLLAYGSSTGRLRQLPGQIGGLAGGLLGRTSFGQQLRPNTQPMPISDYQNYSIYGKTMGQAFGGWVTNNAANIGMLMGQGVLAFMNVADDDWDGLGGQIGGGIAGFLIGKISIIGGPLGAIIGSTIAEAVINGLAEAGTSGELKDAFKGIFAGAIEEPETPDQTREERLLEKQEKLNRDLQRTIGSEWTTGLILWEKSTENFIRELVGIPTRWGDELTATQFAGGAMEQLITAYDRGGTGGVRERAGELGLPGYGILVSDEDIKLQIEGYKELRAEILETNKALEDLGKGVEPEGTVFKSELTENMKEYGDLLKSEIKVAQTEFNEELINGDITIKQYNESMERMGQEGEAIMQIFTAMDDVLGNSADSLLLVLDVVSRTSSEEINIITNLTSGIADLKDQIRDLTAEGDTELVLIKEEELKQAAFELEQVFNQIREAQRQPLIQFATEAPEVLDIKPQEFEIVREEALRMLEERIREYVELGLIPGNTTLQEVIESGTLLGVAFAEAAGAALKSEFDVVLSLFPEAIEKLRGEEAIAPPTPEPSRFRIQSVDMTQAAFEASYNRQLAFLKDAFGSYWQPTLETIGIIFQDGTDVLHLDNLAMQLAMNDLIDVNEKQLQGVYNLPTDASFYVPFQGYELGFDEGGGGLGGAAGALSGAADDLSDAAREIKSLDPGEDWGGTLEQFMFENFGAQRADRPTEFEAFYPKFELPEYGPEYKPPDYGAALIGGEKNLEDYLRPALIGGEKNLQDYANKQETSVDKFGQSVEVFDQGVSNLIGQLEEELVYSQTGLERPGRVIGQGSEAPPPDIFSIIPGGEQIAGFIRELQNVTGIFAKNLFNFESIPEILQQLISGGGISTIGQGAGIGPQFNFSKLDSAADKLSNFADIMTLQPQYQMLGPQQPTSDLATDFSGMLDLLNQKISNLSGFSTNLKISSNYTANLIVDGRVLAQVIKPYLYTDMIRFEDTAASVTKSIVV